MKVQEKHQDVERSGTTEESTFGMKTSARAFDILSTGLYTDNILAIVRELSCNAYDAHVDAGKGNVPFEIHLPNRLEPWFSVKDFGTGLSDEEVRTVYTTYFDTTKDDSNDFIGALGLGSKSPFAYVSSYQVIGRYNGYRRTYAVFINESGIPSITQMGDPLATDEPNGLEVIVTVQEQDMRTFADKVASALMWFPIKPVIHGAPHFEFEQVPDGVLQGENWTLLPTNRRGFGPSSRPLQQPMIAVQGNVGYNVDISKLELSDTVKRLISHRGSDMCFVGFFEIGELEVAASREEIRYDDRSVQALQRVINEFTQDVVRKIEQEFSNLSTSKLWDGFIQIDKKTREMFGNLNLRAVIDDASQVSNPVLKKYIEMGGRFNVPDLYGHTVYVYNTNGYSDSKRMSRHDLGKYPRPDSKLTFFYNDVKHGGIGRIHQYSMQQSTRNSMIVIARRKNPQKIVDVEEWDDDLQDYRPKKEWRPMTDQEVDQEYHKLVDAVGNPDIKIVSQATDPVARKQKQDRTLAAYIFEGYENHRHREPTFRWHRLTSDEIGDMEIDKGGIYIPLRAGSCPNGGSFERRGEKGDLHIHPMDYRRVMSNVIELINQAKGTSYTFDSLLHVGKGSIKKLEKKGWTNVLDLMQDIVPSYADGIAFVQRYINRTGRDGLGILRMLHKKWDVPSTGQFIRAVRQLPNHSQFRATVEPIIEQFEHYYPKMSQLNALESLCAELGINPCDGYDLDGAVDAVTALQDNHYPMLQFVSLEHVSDVEIERVFEYIGTVDQTVENQ